MCNRHRPLCIDHPVTGCPSDAAKEGKNIPWSAARMTARAPRPCSAGSAHIQDKYGPHAHRTAFSDSSHQWLSPFRQGIFEMKFSRSFGVQPRNKFFNLQKSRKMSAKMSNDDQRITAVNPDPPEVLPLPSHLLHMR